MSFHSSPHASADLEDSGDGNFFLFLYLFPNFSCTVSDSFPSESFPIMVVSCRDNSRLDLCFLHSLDEKVLPIAMML